MKQSELRALTLWRPWPHAIFYGGKRIENRPWRPWPSIIGKLIAIHAGVKYDQEMADEMREIGLYDPPEDKWCPKGIVGLARVTGYKEHSGRLIDVFGENQDPWFSGPFGWDLNDITPFLQPVACKGAQGLWVVKGDVLEAVRAAYSKAHAMSAEAG